ncbi:hypothetical protein BDA99DRAFT_544059 [Phascolomyces articulosus]|uniref:Uncharacterized protein n=1 Tax=Phascolomyces articulosus TaxID=60185 RepID=A0AAD5JWR0_9FUNG|nr:hypothetical protein BDA99DRAFT_544059 [Phascolomyces articulosus]
MSAKNRMLTLCHTIDHLRLSILLICITAKLERHRKHTNKLISEQILNAKNLMDAEAQQAWEKFVTLVKQQYIDEHQKEEKWEEKYVVALNIIYSVEDTIKLVAQLLSNNPAKCLANLMKVNTATNTINSDEYQRAVGPERMLTSVSNASEKAKKLLKEYNDVLSDQNIIHFKDNYKVDVDKLKEYTRHRYKKLDKAVSGKIQNEGYYNLIKWKMPEAEKHFVKTHGLLALELEEDEAENLQYKLNAA